MDTGLRHLRSRRLVRERDLPQETFALNAIVVGCDGRPSGDAALRFAAREAQLRHAALVVVIAYVRPVDPDLLSFYVTESDLRSRARLAAEQALLRALGLPAGELLRLHIVTERGPASRVLLRNYRDAQLLVIGMRHRSALRGGTVRYLTRHSSVPVVVVPA